MLFAAFLEAWPAGAPILALEEPEAHLHPSAVRALWGLLKNFAGQKLISTHSGDLLAEAEIHQIRRLARVQDVIRSYRVADDLLSVEETRKFNYHIRQTRGELMFARCWLLVEGESEAWIYPAAARATGIDLHREGIRIVEYRQTDVGLLAKIANALGIAWFCIGDDDSEGEKTRGTLQEHLDGYNEQDRMVFPYPNIEMHLLENEYVDIYDRFMPDQNKTAIASARGDADYWRHYAQALPGRAKTRAAAAVAAEMEQRGRDGVTAEIRDLLQRVLLLSRDP
jgi:putative ATP-dependent endonuclease of OLD family